MYSAPTKVRRVITLSIYFAFALPDEFLVQMHRTSSGYLRFTRVENQRRVEETEEDDCRA